MISYIYLKECLKKRVIPSVLKHNEINVLFWPDMATCHYAGKVVEFLIAENIEFVWKKDNPPNVPQARGIVMFWAECKRRYNA